MNKEIVKYSGKSTRMASLMRYVTGFSGLFILAFGLLKFLPPFKHWYASQIILSGTPGYLYWPGQLSEILAGILLLYPLIKYKNLEHRNYQLSLMAGNLLLMSIMSAAIIVHTDPHVPASVLPLRIKPPYIPSLFLTLACLNVIYMFRSLNAAPDLKTDML